MTPHRKQTKRYFIDTNVLVRYLVGTADVTAAEKAKQIILAALRSKIKLICTEITLAETVYVLEKVYGVSKGEIAQKLVPLISITNLQVDNFSQVRAALVQFAELNVDFADALTCQNMQKMGVTEIFTFDQKHFKRFTRIGVASVDRLM